MCVVCRGVYKCAQDRERKRQAQDRVGSADYTTCSQIPKFWVIVFFPEHKRWYSELKINLYFQIGYRQSNLIIICEVIRERAAVAYKILNSTKGINGTEDFPSIFGGNLVTTFKIQFQWIFPKTEPRKALKLLDTLTHSSPLLPNVWPRDLSFLCWDLETCYFYLTQVLSKKKYIVLHPGQKALS